MSHCIAQNIILIENVNMKKLSYLLVPLIFAISSTQAFAFTAPTGYTMGKSRTMKNLYIEDYRNANGGVIYKIDYNNYSHFKIDEKLVLNGLNCENVEISPDERDLYADECTASPRGSFFSTVSQNTYTVEAYAEDEKIHIVVYNHRVSDDSLAELRW